MADPKLKEAMAEIKAILKKHDIGGAVNLVSKTHSEFAYMLSPSWSIITLKEGYLRMRAKRAEFPSREAQKEAILLSTHLIMQLRDLGAMNADQMQQLANHLSKHIEIEHHPFSDFEPHQEH